jgi:tubulin polyglutamylase TTLL5
MEAQSKLYEEWIEIMSDYATVFSHERGVKETSDENGSTGASSSVYNGGTRSLHYRVKSPRPEVYNIVTDVLNNLLIGWEELPAGLGLGVSWNLLWTWSKPRLNMAHLLSWQKVNHFQDSKQLTRKDLLKKNLQRFTDMTGKIAEAFEIMPQTFLLPHEYTQFVKCFTEIENKREELGVQNYWIMKPVGMSRGRGITLVRDVVSLTYSQTSVVQMYIERPLTLGGYKFDLRLFVCVTSFKPLEAFVYKEGFARVSTHTYSTDPSQMGNKFIHLTNSSIQKQNTAGPTKDNPLMDSEGPGGGSKIPLHGHNGLWERLENSGINVEVLWRNICLVILKSLVVVDEKIANQPCGFELFGYDVLIDEQLRPWLIEVNASPSLARENQLDIRIKNSMIKDTIALVEPAPYDRAAVARILKRRLHDISKNRFTSSKNDTDLDNDLKEIFGDYTPRRIGENPKNMGDYQRLCPNTKIYTHIMRLKGKIIKN